MNTLTKNTRPSDFIYDKVVNKRSGQHKSTIDISRKNAQLRSILTNAHRDYEPMLRKRAFYKINDTEASDDLVQITFLKTWTYLVRGGKIDTMKAFLNHILNGLIIDEYRKKKTTSLDVMHEKGFDFGFEESERHMNHLDGKDALLLIDRLPIKYQRIMDMKYIKGLSLSEMALLTGQTKNTVAVQAHRGLTELQALYFTSELNH